MIDEARRVLTAWTDAPDLQVAPLGHGLINTTFSVALPDGRQWVLQRVHPVFDPEIHDNIALVTERLAARGVTTPRLVPTLDGRRWVTEGGAPWRVQTRIAGHTHERVRSPAQSRAAAALLARFHSALADLPPASFRARRLGVHDTPTHLARLRAAVAEHGDHRLYDEVAPLAEALLAAAEALPPLPEAPERIVHGDPKISNVVFAGAVGAAAEQAIAWIDLDTVAPMPLAYELGDAWRSWCNPRGEDETEARFDEDIFAASLQGWAGALSIPPTPAEREGLLHGVEWITVELASRFAADALAESYFGWDRTRFATRGEHNLVRARGQLALHRAVLATRPRRATALHAAFA